MALKLETCYGDFNIGNERARIEEQRALEVPLDEIDPDSLYIDGPEDEVLGQIAAEQIGILVQVVASCFEYQLSLARLQYHTGHYPISSD